MVHVALRNRPCVSWLVLLYVGSRGRCTPLAGDKEVVGHVTACRLVHHSSICAVAGVVAQLRQVQMRVAIHEMTMGGRDVSYNGLVGKRSMRVGNCTERQYPPACDTQVTAVDTRWNLKRAYPVTSRWAGTRATHPRKA